MKVAGIDLGKRKVALCLLERDPEIYLGIFPGPDRRDCIVQAHNLFYRHVFGKMDGSAFLLYEEPVPKKGWKAYGWLKMVEAVLLANLPPEWGYFAIEVSRLRKLTSDRTTAREMARKLLEKASTLILVGTPTELIPVEGHTASEYLKKYLTDVLDAVVLAVGAGKMCGRGISPADGHSTGIFTASLSCL